MWRTHFEQLYNSVNDNGFKALCYDRLENSTSNDSPYVITVHNVLECVSKQKTRKAVGLDGIAMETIINGGYKLTVHLSLLFNLLIQLRYLPNSFMQSVIVRFVKSKSGDLADVNNYRAIAICTSMSKVLECVIANEISPRSDNDIHQFGF